jgi:hypothetical protein
MDTATQLSVTFITVLMVLAASWTVVGFTTDIGTDIGIGHESAARTRRSGA